METSILAVIGVFGTLWAVVQFWLKNHFEMLESGIKFLTKINKCSAELQYEIKSDNDCVCFDSYSAFAINLSFKQAEALRECWEDYLRCRSKSDHDTNEVLSCLYCLEYNVQKNTEPFNLIEKFKHIFHKLQLLMSGIIGTTDCLSHKQSKDKISNQNTQ